MSGKVYETTRGRPVSIASVPPFCPICGDHVAGGTGTFRVHFETVHPDRVGRLIKERDGVPVVFQPAVLIENALGRDHGRDPIDVILLDSRDKHVEQFDAQAGYYFRGPLP